MNFPVRRILGVNVLVVSQDEALRLISKRLTENTHHKYAYLNVHGANIAFKNHDFAECLSRADVLCDGVGLDIASKWLYGRAFPDNLNGTDFTPVLLQNLQTPKQVSLFGGEPGIAERAIAKLEEIAPQHSYSVLSHGYVGEEAFPSLLTRLQKNRPDILLIAMGNPQQEIWADTYITAKYCKAVFGVGALFDFLAGKVTRAPLWMRRLRAEWIYRLILEPGRLWQRYIVGNPLFLFRVLQQKRATKD